MGKNKSSLKSLCGTCKYYHLNRKWNRVQGNIPTWSICELLQKLHTESTVNKNDKGCSHWTPGNSKYYHHGTC